MLGRKTVYQGNPLVFLCDFIIIEKKLGGMFIMLDAKKVIFESLQKRIRMEVKKQEDSACFLLGYQPKFPQKIVSGHSNKND